VVVVGGGIAGLAAAYYLAKEAPSDGPACRLSVVESSGRFGGKIVTESTDPFIIEGGPESLLTQKHAGIDLCKELNLGDQLLGSRDHARKTFVVHGGRLHPFPRNCRLIAPRSRKTVLGCSLFSLRGRIRAAAEPFVRACLESDDESIASFVTRRFGREYLERFAGPLLSGTSVGDSHRLSVHSLFPQLVAMEREHGSLTAAAGLEHGGAEEPLFTTLKPGMESLVSRLVTVLEQRGVALHRDFPVSGMTRREDGFHLVPGKTGAMNLRADAVILAVPAFTAAGMIRELDSTAATTLDGIRHVGSATMTMGFRRDAVANTPATSGFGFLVPPAERRTILGCTILSNKFDGRADEGFVQIRAFLGGDGFEDQVDFDDEMLLRKVRDDLEAYLGISAEPIVHRIFRWPRGNPQHETGHRRRMERLEQALDAVPGLYLAGSSYYGTGIPDCVKRGKELADKIRG
jgi:oxygen-dependent protoporphyrinogen oxidase